jgi:NAD(P)-dependent dehydrogenase (short-subunit alcohol dehydrogenase family)
MYATEGIRCNVVAPGGVNTSIAKNSSPDKFGYERALSGAKNMPRMGETIEIAQVVKFLSSDEASYINGSTIEVDGGWSAY